MRELTLTFIFGVQTQARQLETFWRGSVWSWKSKKWLRNICALETPGLRGGCIITVDILTICTGPPLWGPHARPTKPSKHLSGFWTDLTAPSVTLLTLFRVLIPIMPHQLGAPTTLDLSTTACSLTRFPSYPPILMSDGPDLLTEKTV